MAPSIVQAAISGLFVSSAWAFSDSSYEITVLGKRADPVVPSVLPGTWTYQGCYTDSGPRSLSGPSFVNTTSMTDKLCISYCDGLGFIYAGTEYSQECYCGNTIASSGIVAPKTDCNMGCKGNTTEVCGGPSRLTIFWNGKTPPAGPSHNPGTLGFGFLGCYTEGNGGRALSNAPTITGGLTVAKCIQACKTGGFSVAGMEYASECYCGNALQNAAVIAPEGLAGCNNVCSGNSSEYCGAGNRLDVYKLGYIGSSQTVSSVVVSSTSQASATSSTTRISSSSSIRPTSSSSSSKTSTVASSSAIPSQTLGIKPIIGAYTYLGCYTEGNGARALGDAAFYDYKAMTLDQCSTSCAGYSYFGVEYGGECYCGNNLAVSSTKAPDADCSFTCPGNAFQYCGAGNRLDMYKLSSIPTSSSTSRGSSVTSSGSTTSRTSTATGLPIGWKYVGCYTEGTGGRALSFQQAGGATNTVENCIAACIGKGYSMAGLEYSEQCFCDDFLYNGAAPTTESKCSMNCAGNAQEKCGAGDILSLYNTGNLTAFKAPESQQTGLPGSWEYKGCWSDNVNNNRALFWQSILRTNNTATNCLNLCAQYGYMAAGMEYGEECFCGDNSVLLTSGSTQQPETDCQVPCSGDKNYYCGGGSRLSYYQWTGTPINVWNTPTGNAAGSYQFLIGGVVIPLITTTGINNKVVFMEKSGTGAPNTTGTYELDLASLNDMSKAWRPLHVKSDIFCSAGITLPDKAGRQLNIGGWAGASTYGVRLYWPDGSEGVWGKNDWQENYSEVSLLAGRWYPSAMVMANGSVLVIGGEVGSNSAPTPSCEILPPPAGGYAKYLDWLDRTDPDNLYPFLWVLPSGGIFVIYYNEARILDEKTFDTIKTLPNMPGSVNNFLSGRTYPLEGTGVIMPMYPPYTAPVTFMACGGSANGAAYAIDNCVSTQPETANPTWTIERMPSQRVMSCICALPDGTYLILNGATEGVAGFGLAQNPNLQAVLYDPSKPINQRMSIMAKTIVARMYHSEAVLLPDGRVLVSGSDPEDGKNPQEYRVEVFNPPYALSGQTPPTFSINKKDWAYGDATTIKITANVPSGNLVAVRASMMAAVSSTHGNSMGQRTLFLAISCTGAATSATCSVTAPPTAHVAPPGWYQIFLLDGARPGKGVWIRIGGEVADAAGIGKWPNFSDFSTPGLGPVA